MLGQMMSMPLLTSSLLLHAESQHGDREIVTSATVRRRNDETVALEFDQLDWDDMFALARFLHPRLP